MCREEVRKLRKAEGCIREELLHTNKKLFLILQKRRKTSANVTLSDMKVRLGVLETKPITDKSAVGSTGGEKWEKTGGGFLSAEAELKE